MSKINTLVYFEIEATGLKSSGKPRICEISLVAVNTQDVLHLGVTNKENSQFCEVTFSPRIVSKLTLCMHPMAVVVPLVSDLTGLDNYNLIGQSTFTKNTSDLINNFLACLPAPVCLIAHDFPLLKAELEKLGTNIDAEILYEDSYRGIEEIFSKKEENKNENLKEIEDKYDAQPDVDAARELMKSGMFETDLLEGQNVTLNENESTPRNKK
jgi:DNA polymerase III epsilon subunit-like protein